MPPRDGAFYRFDSDNQVATINTPTAPAETVRGGYQSKQMPAKRSPRLGARRSDKVQLRMAPTIRANYQFQEQAMNLDDFSMTDEQEEALKEKHDELIENQPELEPNDGCDGGGCVI